MTNNSSNDVSKYIANDENSIAVRKYASRLTMAGRAMIIFGLWSSLRIILIVILNMNEVFQKALDAEQLVGSARTAVYAMSIVLIIIILIIPFLFNLYLGRRAMREAKGGKKSTVYLVWTGIFVVAVFSSMLFVDGEGISLLGVAANIVDLTLCIAGIDIIYSAIRLRQYKKLTEGEVK